MTFYFAVIMQSITIIVHLNCFFL